MIRDWAGLDSSSDDEELDSAGPGDGERRGSACCAAGWRGISGDFGVADVMGNDESLRRPPVSAERAGTAFAGRGDEPPASRRIVVLADVFRDITGLAERFSVAPEPPSSLLRGGMGESLRDRADAVR